MPCVAHECHPRLPAANHCRSLSCLGTPAAGWSSGDDDREEDELDTKQVILNEMRNREMRKRSSRCSVDSPTLSGAFAWSFTPLHPRSSIEKVSCTEEEKEAASDSDNESEAFFSVKSFFTRSTSRAATVASSTDMDPPATWEGLRGCEGWPFGLCRRPAVPPLPSTPADSWKWRKRSRNLAEHSPAPAYSLKITTNYK
ncbi:uncharacterized protein [Aegilops tauschii subsp. strangulata]|uniref:Uncharacterized protein n=1 Tax=Aegilops tauschii subsp. strangulata TaxID=200361 RepID=A0A453KZN3_AEGTS|nr:uncharacterized protein LOC109779539 isoform X2 [Aegilops tauschii subsp. strangulata]XP_044397703.1 uncharacterized protein LOC123121742 [Triticum aestivum]